MVVRPRVICLALAAWAVLFAPGVAGADAQDGLAAPDADRVAAAMVAPTFGTDGVVVARPSRSDRDDGPVDVGGTLPVALVVVAIAGLIVAAASTGHRSRGVVLRWCGPPRGPPVS